MTSTYGDRYDDRIRTLATEGHAVCQVADMLRISVSFCRKRAYAIGLKEMMRENGYRQARRPTGIYHGKCSAVWRAVAAQVRADHTASDLARSIRSRRPAADVATDNALACLHLRGLTLPDFHVCFGIPPAQAVASIRRALA